MNQHRSQIADLTAQLAGPDEPGESYLEKVGRITNARSRATEIVMEDQPRPVDQDDWEHRFEIWQGGHPIMVLLREFYTTADEIEDRMIDVPEDLSTLTHDMNRAKEGLRTDLTELGLPADLIALLLEPILVPGMDETIWVTPPTAAASIESILRSQWEALPAQVRETSWDAPSDGADYFQATQRVAQGLPRF